MLNYSRVILRLRVKNSCSCEVDFLSNFNDRGLGFASKESEFKFF